MDIRIRGTKEEVSKIISYFRILSDYEVISESELYRLSPYGKDSDVAVYLKIVKR